MRSFTLLIGPWQTSARPCWALKLLSTSVLLGEWSNMLRSPCTVQPLRRCMMTTVLQLEETGKYAFISAEITSKATSAGSCSKAKTLVVVFCLRMYWARSGAMRSKRVSRDHTTHRPSYMNAACPEGIVVGVLKAFCTTDNQATRIVEEKPTRWGDDGQKLRIWAAENECRDFQAFACANVIPILARHNLAHFLFGKALI